MRAEADPRPSFPRRRRSHQWWALALGVGLGGNGTHIGATTNVICITEAERAGLPAVRITPGRWLRAGLPVMFTSLSVASVVFALFFSAFSRGGWRQAPARVKAPDARAATPIARCRRRPATAARPAG